jgi:hypothetical protein
VASKLDRFDEQNQGEITQPTLVLCEGKRDASFVLHLAEQRGINGIQVGFPDPITSDTHGKDGFREYLTKLRVRQGFKDVLRRVVIVRDRNGSDTLALQEVVRQVVDAGSYQVPTALEEETAGAPTITVRLIPDNVTEGNLDVFLLSAIDANHPLRECYERYFTCCNLNALPVGKTAKIKLTTIVAASCRSNPSCSLVWVWKEPGNPIPLASSRFDELESFLRRFEI